MTKCITMPLADKHICIMCQRVYTSENEIGDCPNADRKDDTLRFLQQSQFELRTITAAANCVHLGEVIRLEDCPTCKGTVKQKIYACKLFVETTLSQCAFCVSYEPKTTEENKTDQ